MADWKKITRLDLLIAVGIISAGMLVVLGATIEVGTARTIGVVERVAVTDAPDTGAVERPEDTPWRMVGVTEVRNHLLEPVARALGSPGESVDLPGDAGEPESDQIVNAAAGAAAASTAIGGNTGGTARLGPGRGHSSGLIAALAYVDANGADPAGCDPEATRPQTSTSAPGRQGPCIVVAATGTIDDTGTVGAIGALPEKMRGARNAGVAVLFIPYDNLDLDGLDRRGMTWGSYDDLLDAGRKWRPHGPTTIVAVEDLHGALTWLCGAVGDPTTCDLAGVEQL